MLGAWATAYLIHVKQVQEVVVLKKWYFDIPKLGKAAASLTRAIVVHVSCGAGVVTGCGRRGLACAMRAGRGDAVAR